MWRTVGIYLYREDIKLEGNQQNYNSWIYMTVLHYYWWTFSTVFMLCNQFFLFVWCLAGLCLTEEADTVVLYIMSSLNLQCWLTVQNKRLGQSDTAVQPPLYDLHHHVSLFAFLQKHKRNLVVPSWRSFSSVGLHLSSRNKLKNKQTNKQKTPEKYKKGIVGIQQPCRVTIRH